MSRGTSGGELLSVMLQTKFEKSCGDCDRSLLYPVGPCTLVFVGDMYGGVSWCLALGGSDPCWGKTCGARPVGQDL